VLFPHASEWKPLAILAVAVTPLALIAGMKPALRVAPITAIIVLLVPAFTQAPPLASAIDRVLEVAVGGIVAFLVSLLVLPSRATAKLPQRPHERSTIWRERFAPCKRANHKAWMLRPCIGSSTALANRLCALVPSAPRPNTNGLHASPSNPTPRHSCARF
jgi:hypothetical protein